MDTTGKIVGTIVATKEYRGEIFVRVRFPSGIEADWIPVGSVVSPEDAAAGK